MTNNLSTAPDLPRLNKLLTQLMAKKRIQPALADGGLESVVKRIKQLAAAGGALEKMTAAASLTRLAAVSRGGQEIILDEAAHLLTERPETLSRLASADERTYFASCLSRITGDWVLPYCVEEIVREEGSEKTRSELIKAALGHAESVAVMISMLSPQFFQLDLSANKRLVRARRVLACLNAELSATEYNCGESIGKSVESLAKSIFKSKKDVVQSGLTKDAFDELLELPLAAIRSRFSLALKPETFDALQILRGVVDRKTWREYLNESSTIARTRTCFLESALILARQNRTDDTFMRLLIMVYVDRGFLRGPLEKHFANATDIETVTREWWISLGRSTGEENSVEQKLDISVDHQIGALLIEGDAAEDGMGKLASDIVPLLEISDPVLAPIMKRAHANYTEISRVAKQLAKMRRLELVRERGKTVEYNPSQHEMIGGHQSGVRNVRVIRDGVKKDFGGQIKTILKCWVESV